MAKHSSKVKDTEHEKWTTFQNLLYLYTDGIIKMSSISPLHYTESGGDEPLIYRKKFLASSV